MKLPTRLLPPLLLAFAATAAFAETAPGAPGAALPIQIEGPLARQAFSMIKGPSACSTTVGGPVDCDVYGQAITCYMHRDPGDEATYRCEMLLSSKGSFSPPAAAGSNYGQM